MSDDVLVKVDGVSKKFCRSLKKSLWYGMQDVGSELMGRKGSSHDDLRAGEFWAVNDVSFELKRGECLGLIGPNGAGKSTLLKMLNGLIKPDKGRITMRGRIGALIELGAGFNPILTARENIYVNGAVLGFSKKEIDAKFDEIVDFAEIEEFVDTPVQNFSSGMKVRLGFAIAAQMEPDVLLIDEVLAVGDAAFKTRCIAKIAEISKKTAIVFVSHSMPLIGRICTNAILIQSGCRLLESTYVPENIAAYQKLNLNQATYSMGENNICLKRFTVISGGTEKRGQIIEVDRFASVNFVLECELLRELKDFQVNFVLFDEDEKAVAESFSSDHGFYISAHCSRTNIQIHVSQLPLNPGRYSIAVGFIERLPDGSRGEIYFTKRGVTSLVVRGNSIGYAPVQLACNWAQFE